MRQGPESLSGSGAGAVKLLDGVLQEDPLDRVAANNKAVCLLYGGSLTAAIQVRQIIFSCS